jgi:CheY-like chemotaxis protein
MVGVPPGQCAVEMRAGSKLVSIIADWSRVTLEPHKSHTIVVVDDHDDTRRYLALFLRWQLNATVIEARNASECLREIETRRPTLVLSDILMPGCDGFEMLREIRALEKNGEPRIPVIAMTGLGSEADHKRIFEAGFCAYLEKPFTPDQLIETIRSVLD